MLIDPILRAFWEGEHGDGWCEPGRLIYDCELVYNSGGESRVVVDGQEYILNSRDYLIIAPGLWHETMVNEYSFRHCFHFDWTREYLDIPSPLQVSNLAGYQKKLEHTPPLGLKKKFPLYGQADEHLQCLIKELISELRIGGVLADYRLWPILRKIMDDNTAVAIMGVDRSVRAVLRVKDMIERDYGKAVDYTDFCRETHLSKSHLCSVFSGQLGMAPVAYLNHVRLEQAARMLRNSDLNIAEIARSCGIGNANYFSRIFRKKYGCTPREYAGLG